MEGSLDVDAYNSINRAVQVSRKHSGAGSVLDLLLSIG